MKCVNRMKEESMWPTLLEKVNDYTEQTRSVFPLTVLWVPILRAFLLVGPLFCIKLHHFKTPRVQLLWLHY